MLKSDLFPPNYEMIKLVFPNCAEYKPIFAYGDTIYNPFKIEITKDLEIHEEVHSKRQGNNPAEWWGKYLSDREFRLQEEIIAYGTQYAWVSKLDMKTEIKNWLKDQMAQALSSETYGNLLSYGEAESKIRNYAKNV